MPISAIFGIYLGNEAKYKKSGRTMTFAAAKLVQVQIFVSIEKVIAKKNADVRKICTPTDDRPTARNHDSNTPLGFQPEG